MKREVALIVETSSQYGRDLLEGIVRFMRLHEDWSVFLEQRDLTKKPPAWLATWKGDGIISRATTPKLAEAIESTRIPFIDLTDRRQAAPEQPQVRSDDLAIGQMGATHLLERGFHRFAFCGFSGEAWSQRREQGFATAVGAADGSLETYRSAWEGRGAHSWADEQRQLAEWLSKLPTPLGIMACNDVRGQHVMDACARLALAVPEEVAVVGVDNDEQLCRMCAPPLSSVIPSAERIGYRAAELLAQLMDGQPATASLDLIAPMRVATRQSTDVVAIDDKLIAEALHYIRQNACRGMTVNEITQHVPVSRSSLERKLRKYLGRTPQEEIRFVQVKKAQELLATTDLSTERIAVHCGFQHPEYLHVVFKRLTGMTLGEYRRRVHPS